MFGFFKFVGEWETTELEPNKILIKYTYYLHSNILLLYPFHWLFAQTFWRNYMKRVTENIRTLAYSSERVQTMRRSETTLQNTANKAERF
jgi:hypothetical protein